MITSTLKLGSNNAGVNRAAADAERPPHAVGLLHFGASSPTPAHSASVHFFSPEAERRRRLASARVAIAAAHAAPLASAPASGRHGRQRSAIAQKPFLRR